VHLLETLKETPPFGSTPVLFTEQEVGSVSDNYNKIKK
jgi:hypothetical protein